MKHIRAAVLPLLLVSCGVPPTHEEQARARTCPAYATLLAGVAFGQVAPDTKSLVEAMWATALEPCASLESMIRQRQEKPGLTATK